MIQPLPQSKHFVATRNACKMCTPLGACLAFTGVEGCVPFLHGSQGCSTYIRRYLISHFREPMDIASSNFGEQAAIFGGQTNLTAGLTNVIHGYRPTVIGIATTCLSETIGDDVPLFLHEFKSRYVDTTPLPHLVHASTPSYTGSHFDGYMTAVRSIVNTIAEAGPRDANLVNLLPGMISPADIRYLHDVAADFGLDHVLLPDYADRLDGPTWTQYQRIPPGGTTVADIQRTGRAAASIEMTSVFPLDRTAGSLLEERFGVPRHRIDLPIGVAASDRLFELLEQISGKPTPKRHADERGRLIDSYVDAHKYLFGKRTILFGEEDLVVAMAAFCSEIGLTPTLCATGGTSGKLAETLAARVPGLTQRCHVMEGVDFEELTEAAEAAEPDIIIGHSKGFKLAQRLSIPLLRIGLPIHDRIGGARILHLGYRGTQQLFDRVVNTLLDVKQTTSEVGYTYL